MRQPSVAIVGAGIGGLAAAMKLSAAGVGVDVFERAAAPGGKMGAFLPDDASSPIDAGPTVLTLRHVFEELFECAGGRLADHVALTPLPLLARHFWPGGGRLDLPADQRDAAAAIGDFAGPADARGYLRFCAESKRVYDCLEAPFLRASRPSLAGLVRSAWPGGLVDLASIRPFMSLWRALGRYFQDERLRQLFARYATYSGASPFAAPATLMLIAHVEQSGVWQVSGGMHRLARAMESQARTNGATFRYGTEVSEILVRRGCAVGLRLSSGEEIAAGAVLANADCMALSGGLLGAAARKAVPARARRAPSLSAVVWTGIGRARGLPLSHHTVAFSPDYKAEFGAIGRGGPPARPTVYVCAQDRRGDGNEPSAGDERFLCLVNACASAAGISYSAEEKVKWRDAMERSLASCGVELRLDPDRTLMRTPNDFAAMFPATDGALYGPAMHGWQAAFRRPGVRSRIEGLYLAGGSVHPGPGVPMVALSGWMAAESILASSVSTAPSRPAAMRGGTLTASATTGRMRSR